MAYVDGEDLDPESGMDHLAHIMACCAVLLDAKAAGKLNDDRTPGPAPEYLSAEVAKVKPPSPITVTTRSLLAIALNPDSVVHRDLREAATAEVFLPPTGATTLIYEINGNRTEMVLKKSFRVEDLDYVHARV
jgi:hypothetical protein